MIWLAAQCFLAALVLGVMHYAIFGVRRMSLFILVAVILLVLSFVLAGWGLHRFYVPKGPKQDARELCKLNNLLVCVDCAGHIAAHRPWCGQGRPEGFVDGREVRDPVVDPDAIRKPRARKRVSVA